MLEIIEIGQQFGTVLKYPVQIPYHKPIFSVSWISFLYEIEFLVYSYADHKKNITLLILHIVISVI